MQVNQDDSEIEAPSFEDIASISSSSIKDVAWNIYEEKALDQTSLIETSPIKDFGISAMKQVGGIMLGEVFDSAQYKYIGANASYTIHYEV